MLCPYILYMHIAPFHSQPSHSIHARVENEKGLCAYILYMHIATFQSQPSHSMYTRPDCMVRKCWLKGPHFGECSIFNLACRF